MISSSDEWLVTNLILELQETNNMRDHGGDQSEINMKWQWSDLKYLSQIVMIDINITIWNINNIVPPTCKKFKLFDFRVSQQHSVVFALNWNI